MPSRGKRSVSKSTLNSRNGHDAEGAAKALEELRTIGGLLVRSSVGLLNGDAADQFVWLGRQIETRAAEGMAALGHQDDKPGRQPKART